MASYYLDEELKNGAREVHAAGCSRLPDFLYRIYLGEYGSDRLALRKAAARHDKVARCADCCSPGVEPPSGGVGRRAC